MTPDLPSGHADDLFRALVRARDMALARDLEGILNLDLALDLAGELARTLNDVRADDRDLARAGDLASNLTRTLNHVRSLDHARVLGLDRIRDFARDLDSTLNLDLALRRSVDRTAEAGPGERNVPPSTRSRAQARRVAPPARRLAAVATWLLSTRERARYGEEYRSELHELAASGAGRCQQLGYAVRLLMRAVPLRLAVLVPRHGKAGP
jgi:hypothetical protein